MKKSLVLPLLAMIVFSIGCGESMKQNDQKQNSAADSVQQISQEGVAGEDSEEISGKLVLNNGSKWQANAETTEGIKVMLTLVNEHLNQGSTDVKALSANLDKEFGNIIQRCTMTDEAHNQLHNYLLPLKAKIEKLKESSELNSVQDIQADLLNYQNYFQ